MTFFPLSNDDRGKLQRLNKQPDVVFALKKLFLNTATKGTLPDNVQTLAAERIAIDIVTDAFHKLETIQPDTQTGKQNINLV